jgi:hypothetical protein
MSCFIQRLSSRRRRQAPPRTREVGALGRRWRGRKGQASLQCLMIFHPALPRPTDSLWGWIGWGAVFFAGLAGLWAHPSDISYLRVRVERQSVELRFTFNLLTLSRFALMDADRDGAIRRAELDAAASLLQTYLKEHVAVVINERPAGLGDFKGLESMWPEGQEADVVNERDYPVRYVDITFHQQVTPLLADLGLDFAIWQETGALGTLEATYEQGDLRLLVPFSQSEPDYVYDTGFAVESVFQESSEISPKMPQTTETLWSLAWLLGVLLTTLIGWQWKRQHRPAAK